MYTVYKNFYQI